MSGCTDIIGAPPGLDHARDPPAATAVPIAAYRITERAEFGRGRGDVGLDAGRQRMTVPADDAISAGAAAWAQIYRVTAFENWKAIALAGAIGRQHALRESKSNKPFGKRYAAAINDWLESNGCHIESARSIPLNKRFNGEGADGSYLNDVCTV
jgi:hypothetical protein